MYAEISQIQLFSNLEPDDLALLSRHGKKHTYPKGTRVINEGDESDSFYLIENGSVKVYASDENGKEITLNILGAGQYFGELALIDSAPRSASVETLEACRLTIVSKSMFDTCLAENPALALKLFRPLVQMIRDLTDKVKSLALDDVYPRVRNALMKLAEEQDGELVIEQRLTHQDIANMVGACREMVTRVLRELKAGGYIDTSDRKIRVLKKLPPRF